MKYTDRAAVIAAIKRGKKSVEWGRSLYLSGTGITALPEGLHVGGWLDLSGTGITALPEGLHVGGWLDLSGTGITALPEGLHVGGSLYLRGTPMQNYFDDQERLARLLTGGGKTVQQVSEAWECHKWENCPMHAAFGAYGLSEVPEPYRRAAAIFVPLFDAGLIPKPGGERPGSAASKE